MSAGLRSWAVEGIGEKFIRPSPFLPRHQCLLTPPGLEELESNLNIYIPSQTKVRAGEAGLSIACAMLAAFAQELAAMLLEMSDQIAPLHAAVIKAAVEAAMIRWLPNLGCKSILAHT